MTVGSSSELDVYGSGVIVAHDRDHHEDRCGQLSLEPLDEAVWAPFEIDMTTDQERWSRRSTGLPDVRSSALCT